ncbi:MAG: N-acetylmuramate alpha-1-phosphate uridylyltransferase MurU [Wenzhouxiangella sp.]
MRAMILAAGRGERLRPLTDTTPKPLLEVGGKPLIGYHLERLATAGFEDVVINLGWLGEQISSALGTGASFGLNIHYSPEPPGALETAGGIVQALPLLGNQPFAVISGDILCDYPYEKLVGIDPEGLAHLVMVSNPDHHSDGDFRLVDGRLEPGPGPRLTFSGIGVYQPAMFRNLAPGRRPLRPVFEQALSAGQLSGEHHRGNWSDIGTIERLDQARQWIQSR